MICRIKGELIKKTDTCVVININGLFYEIFVAPTVSMRLNSQPDGLIELVIYHYFTIDSNRGLPMMIGFIDDFEKEFFEKFISVSGIGPRAALRAFDKPIARIAQAIEEGDMDFLKTLSGIGNQKAKQIIASLQGKVGRFALIKGQEIKPPAEKSEIAQEAKHILKRLQYSAKEIDEMVNKVLSLKPEIDTIEDFLNEIYRQKV